MNIRFVDVAVGNVWSSPEKPRDLDAPSLSRPADIKGWLSRLDGDEKGRIDLVGRLETQVLYGEPVWVVGEGDGWAEIRVPEQYSHKDESGYPGWIPLRAAHLSSGLSPGVANGTLGLCDRPLHPVAPGRERNGTIPRIYEQTSLAGRSGRGSHRPHPPGNRWGVSPPSTSPSPAPCQPPAAKSGSPRRSGSWACLICGEEPPPTDLIVPA